MAERPFQFSLLTLFGWVTFAAVMFWLSTFGVLGVILAVAVSKHVLVAQLCMWQSRRNAAVARAAAKTRVAPEPPRANLIGT